MTPCRGDVRAQNGPETDCRDHGSVKVSRAIPDTGHFRLLLIGSILVIIAVGNQILSGAFSAQRDDGGHYVTTLMIRDYLAAGTHNAPLAFAKECYAHYPGVCFGLWSPSFHLFSGAWMLVVGTGRWSALALLATVATAWSALLF
jgi:hypothetical protein